jgi:serine/threonine protein kinase
MKKSELNNVKNRFLPIPQSALKGLEPEPKIKDFEILKELGCGSFGRVFLARHLKTKVLYAIKAIDKQNKTNIDEKPYFRRELEVMYKIHHPNVVKLFGHFEDNKYCYFIMEFISRGNVYNLLTLDKKKILSTKLVATIMKDVISATYFLHNMNPPIIHRDIKPENVLLNEGMVAKLTDFGWSNYIQEEKERKTVCGTPIYLAPEIIKEQGHDERVDIWCIGVLLFELITGSVPFRGNDIETLKSNILHLKITWPKEMNPDAKDLISKILKLDPNKRLPLEDMLQHPFFLKYFPDAPNCLILPDPDITYKTFIVSKDDPKTWDPVQKNTNLERQNVSGPSDNTSGTSNNMKKQPQDKYALLQEKYENLKNDYYAYKSGNQSLNEIEELKRKIKEKNEKLEQLMKGNKIEEDDKDLKSKCNNLESENNDLRNQVLAFEKRIKDQQSQSIDSKLNEFRSSIVNYDKDYDFAFEDLKNHLNKETRQNLNEIIRNKDQEIEKYKEEEKARREKEKKKYTSLINKYDQTLSWVEKENQELKRKIKELEAKLPKK